MTYEPAPWLRNLAQTSKVTHWPWRHSLRLVLITTIPMAIGFHTGHVVEAMILCLGGVLTAVKVQTDPYRIRFRRILISAPIGMSGYIIGALIGGYGIWTIAGVVTVSFLSGLISSYGAAFSAASLQMLVMTVVAAHTHGSAPIWLMPSLYLAGACYASALLALEALITPNNPERKIILGLVSELANVANISIRQDQDSEAFRAAYNRLTGAQLAAYQALLDNQRQADGRSVTGDYHAKILGIIDRISTLLNVSPQDKALRAKAAQQLQTLAHELKHPKNTHDAEIAADYADSLTYNIFRLHNEIAPLLQSRSTQLLHDDLDELKPVGHIHLTQLKDKFYFGHETIVTATKLALCMFVAMIAEYAIPGERTYWIPLSVAVILKPDFGSIFVRAVLRSVGTLAGVILATAIFMLVPKGMPLIVVIAILSALLPWASLKSYAFMCTFLTPLVLILIDLIIPGPTINYGEPRLIDTLIGACIVLVFGQLIWPNSSVRNFQRSFTSILQALAAYLEEIVQKAQDGPQRPTQVFDDTTATRRHAYAELSNMRIRLQRLAAEPPPASTQALAWLPAIASCERICDYISNYALQTKPALNSKENEAVAIIIAALKNLTHETAAHDADDDTLSIETNNMNLMNIMQNILNIQKIYSHYGVVKHNTPHHGATT
ncbi:FUSC family protein [Daeguia caeni]|uniref:FUSC family protein n=1 Tax=Daeguia caeni TaxID=439612 RepID=A0ABV9H6F6_9HYPH